MERKKERQTDRQTDRHSAMESKECMLSWREVEVVEEEEEEVIKNQAG